MGLADLAAGAPTTGMGYGHVETGMRAAAQADSAQRRALAAFTAQNATCLEVMDGALSIRAKGVYSLCGAWIPAWAWMGTHMLGWFRVVPCGRVWGGLACWGVRVRG